jgi:hypothetical protein
MKCIGCGGEVEAAQKFCTSCGRAHTPTGTPVVPPGTPVEILANGSDEVRNSRTHLDEVVVREPSNPGRPPGDIIEGTGG